MAAAGSTGETRHIDLGPTEGEGWPMGGYTKVPNAIVLRADLSLFEFKTCVALCYFGRSDTKCWPGQERLAEVVGCCVRTLRDVLYGLQRLGLIRIQRRQRKSNLYHLHFVTDVYGKGVPQPTSDRQPVADQGAVDRHARPLDRQPTADDVLSVKELEGSPSRAREETPATSPEADALADDFFESVGPRNPSRQMRQKAIAVVGDLLAQGFTPDDLRVANQLAAQRGARGPELLPHIVSEAREQILKDKQEHARRAQAYGAAERRQQEDTERQAAFARVREAIEALSRDEIEALRQEVRRQNPLLRDLSDDSPAIWAAMIDVHRTKAEAEKGDAFAQGSEQ